MVSVAAADEMKATLLPIEAFGCHARLWLLLLAAAVKTAIITRVVAVVATKG